MRLCIITVSPGNLRCSLTQIPETDLNFVSLSLSKRDSTVQFCSNATPLLPWKLGKMAFSTNANLIEPFRRDITVVLPRGTVT